MLFDDVEIIVDQIVGTSFRLSRDPAKRPLEYQPQLSAKGRYRFPMVILQYRGPNYGCNAFSPW